MENNHVTGGSLLVPLQTLNSYTDDDPAFPRLDTVKFEYSKILVKIRRASGKPSLLEIAASDTVADLKRRVILKDTPIEHIKVELAGKALANERTLSESGVVTGSELSIILHQDDGNNRPLITDQREQLDMVGGPATDTEVLDELEEPVPVQGLPRGINIEPEAAIRGLVGKASARVLHDWSGTMQDGESLGLPLRAQDVVMIGRVVNRDWYEGYLPNDLDRCGYIPRNYVKIDSVYNQNFLESLGADGHGLQVSSTAPPSPPPRRRRGFLSSFPATVLRIFCGRERVHQRSPPSRNPSDPPLSGPPPPLPPSPFPSKPPIPGLDLLQQGNRVRVDFQLEHSSPKDQPIVQVVLSLVPGPQARISHATVELEFEHDTIFDLEPKRASGPETEVYHSNNVSNEFSAGGGANAGSAQLNIGLTHTNSRFAEYSRRTRGTVVGDGKGSSRAYWVFKEDSGEAARFGLDPEQRMSVMLHVRPVRMDYQVNFQITADDGTAGGRFKAKRASSGRQRYYFMS